MLVDAIADAVLARLRPALAEAQAVRPRLLTVDQAARYLGRSAKAVYALVARQAFPAVQADGHVMLDVRDLDRWIDQSNSGGFHSGCVL